MTELLKDIPPKYEVAIPPRIYQQDASVITTPLPEQSWFHKHEPLVIGTAAVVIVLSLWQLMGVVREQKIELPLGITMPSRLFLPSPSDVIASQDPQPSSTAAPNSTVSAPSHGLPFTGLDLLTLVVLGALLVAAGLALAALARFRRRALPR